MRKLALDRLAYAFALLLALVHLPYRILWRWFFEPGLLFHSASSEGIKETIRAKWWLHSQSSLLNDGLSGDFAAFGDVLSGLLLNGLSLLSGISPMELQVLLGPVLAAAFVLVSYTSLRAALRDRKSALIATILLSFLGVSGLSSALGLEDADSVARMLPLPIFSIGKVDGWSLGFLLLIPTVSNLYLAHSQRNLRRQVSYGVLLGVLFLTSFTIFANALFISLFYLYFQNSVVETRRRQRLITVMTMLFTGAYLFLLFENNFRLSVSHIAGGMLLLLVANLLFDSNKRFYLVSFPVAAIVAAPYLPHFFTFSNELDGLLLSQTFVRLPFFRLILIFLPGLLLTFWGVLYLRERNHLRSGQRKWVLAIGVATFLFSFNYVFGWPYDPVRYVALLLVPISILAAICLRWRLQSAMSAVAALPILIALLWIGIQVVVNIGKGVFQKDVSVVEVAKGQRSFLQQVKHHTRPGEYILLEPANIAIRAEYDVAKILNFSRARSFLPDAGAIFERRVYDDRLKLFCFLYPNYLQGITKKHVPECEGVHASTLGDPNSVNIGIRNAALKSNYPHAIGITWTGAINNEFAAQLMQATRLYAWRRVSSGGGRILSRLMPVALPGVAALSHCSQERNGLSCRMSTVLKGSYALVVGGTNLKELQFEASMNEAPIEANLLSNQLMIAMITPSEGAHALRFDWKSNVTREPIYFVAAVASEYANTYLEAFPETLQ